MKLQDFLNRLDLYFNRQNTTPALAELVTMYELLPVLRYNKGFLKSTMKTAKKIEKRFRTAKKITENFSKYVDLKFVIIENDRLKEDGSIVFFKDGGTLIVEISENLMQKIGNILIEKGYTDKNGFFKTLEKDPLSLIILFIGEVKEETSKKWNILNKILSKKEIKAIEKIFKQKQKNGNKSDIFDTEVEEAKEYIEKFAEELIRKVSVKYKKGGR